LGAGDHELDEEVEGEKDDELELETAIIVTAG
jgi:hypothetical protein